MSKSNRWLSGLAAITVGGMVAATTLSPTSASSHREAPLITEDPVADATDTYAFVSPDAPDTVTLIGNFIPLEPPAAGPNFHRFGDDVLYSFEVDTNGDSRSDKQYEFRFKTTVKSGDTFLYNTGQVTSLDDADLNVVQSYTVSTFEKGRRKVLAQDLIVAPANVGPRSMPDYDSLAEEATYEFGDGFKVFAGPRDDPFFADLGSIFDLLGLRPFNEAHLIPRAAEDGVDYLAPYNVHTIALQVPISEFASEYNEEPIIGVHTTSSRRSTRVLAKDGASIGHRGKWIQVSRLGNPLVNEVVIPLKDKDVFNGSEPQRDSRFAEYVLDPEPARLIPFLYPGVTVPEAPRNDLVAIFLTGVPGLNMPDGVTPSEQLRLNTAIKPTESNPNDQSRMGLLGGDNDGFPNGRRLVDDVVDIEIQALAGATPFTPEFNVFPNNALGDGVDSNDVPFLSSFPYVPGPQSGYERP